MTAVLEIDNFAHVFGSSRGASAPARKSLVFSSNPSNVRLRLKAEFRDMRLFLRKCSVLSDSIEADDSPMLMLAKAVVADFPSGTECTSITNEKVILPAWDWYSDAGEIEIHAVVDDADTLWQQSRERHLKDCGKPLPADYGLSEALWAALITCASIPRGRHSGCTLTTRVSNSIKASG